MAIGFWLLAAELKLSAISASIRGGKDSCWFVYIGGQEVNYPWDSCWSVDGKKNHSCWFVYIGGRNGVVWREKEALFRSCFSSFRVCLWYFSCKIRLKSVIKGGFSWQDSGEKSKNASEMLLQIVEIQRIMKKYKINENFFQKGLEGKEKAVSLHSQNNGNGVED